MGCDMGYLQTRINKVYEQTKKNSENIETIIERTNKYIKEIQRERRVLIEMIEIAKDKNKGINIVQKLDNDVLEKIADYVFETKLTKVIHSLNTSNSKEIKELKVTIFEKINEDVNSKFHHSVKTISELMDVKILQTFKKIEANK